MIEEKMKTIIVKKIKSNIKIPIIFTMIGFIFALLRFDFNTKSNISLFVTMATILAALVGFIGIFVVFKLQNIHDMKYYYIKRIDKFKDELKIYPITSFPKNEDEIVSYTNIIKENIQKLNDSIDHKIGSDDITNDQNELKLYGEISFLVGQINEKIKDINNFGKYNDSFLFTIVCIFLFTIPIIFDNIHILNNNYVYDYFALVFENWRFLEMSLTGFLFGLYFIAFKDLFNMLANFFTRY